MNHHFKRNSFPNYLKGEQKMDEPHLKKEIKESTFVADEKLDTTPSVPFLQDASKLNRREQHELENNRRLNYSLYRSRRPFKPTEVPSLWQPKERATVKTDKVNFQRIKEDLYVSDEELILIDTNPPEMTPVSQETKKTLKDNTTNKALNRSLKGIMEQEKLQKPWENKSLWTTKSRPSR